MKPLLLLLMQYCLLAQALCCQNVSIDSLKAVLTNQKEDTSKVNTLTTISEIVRTEIYNANDTAYTSAILYAQQALLLAEKLNFRKGMRSAWRCLAIVNYFKKNYNE